MDEASEGDNEKRDLAFDRYVDKSVKKIKNILTKYSTTNLPGKNIRFSFVEVEIVSLLTKQPMCTLKLVANIASIANVKELFAKKYPQYYPSRQSFRLGAESKSLKDTDTLADFNLIDECTLYFKDLGPQISPPTVFYCEDFGPLILYLLLYIRPALVYGSEYAFNPSTLPVVRMAAMCHTFHYAKRLLEMKFIHRLSHGTMPIMNLVLSSGYYWAFAAWMSYFVNHPLYTPPLYGNAQIYLGLAIFIVCELGNLSIHVFLKNLRHAGAAERQMPKPTVNPFTWLVSLVSCPNYTYEVGSWIGFVIMTQTFVGLLFALAGGLQLSHLALVKHGNYRKEFPDYPRSRKAMIPFIL